MQAERDRQADLDHVARNAFNESSKLVGPGQMQGTERQNDQIHKQEDCHSVEQTAHQPMVGQKLQFAAGQAIDRGRRERDEEV